MIRQILLLMSFLVTMDSLSAQWSFTTARLQGPSSVGRQIVRPPVTHADIDGDGVVDYFEIESTASAAVTTDLVSLRSGQNGGAFFSTTTAPGAGIVGVGDLDGDSIPDWLEWTATGAIPPCPGLCPPLLVFTGAVTARSGTTGAVLSTAPVAAADHARYGDFDQDGVEDIAMILYPTATTFTNTTAIMSGAGGAILPGFGATGAKSLDSIADTNGNGVRELFVGGAATATSFARVLVFDGGASPIATVNLDVSVPGVTLLVRRIGDVDGDGVDDVAATAGSSTVERVAIISGATRSVIRTHTMSLASNWGGFSGAVSNLGDLDLDGREDYAVASSGVITGASGTLTMYSGATGAALSFDNLGTLGLRSAVGMGDADLDGRPDILVMTSALAVPNGTVELRNIDPVVGGDLPASLGPEARGAIGAAFGGPYDTLFFQGSSGRATRRIVWPIGAPFRITLRNSPTMQSVPARSAIFGTLGDPGATSGYAISGIGSMCFPPSVLFPNFPWLFMVAESITGQNLGILPAAPGEFNLVAPSGIPFALTFALQAVEESIPQIFAVSNAIVIEIR